MKCLHFCSWRGPEEKVEGQNCSSCLGGEPWAQPGVLVINLVNLEHTGNSSQCLDLMVFYMQL